jgi:hypothetical protein
VCSLWKSRQSIVPNLDAHATMYLWQHKKRSCPDDDICERLGVAPVEEKLVQHCLRWSGHIQWRPTEAPIHSGVISRISNGKKGRGRSNLI